MEWYINVNDKEITVTDDKIDRYKKEFLRFGKDMIKSRDKKFTKTEIEALYFLAQKKFNRTICKVITNSDDWIVVSISWCYKNGEYIHPTELDSILKDWGIVIDDKFKPYWYSLDSIDNVHVELVENFIVKLSDNSIFSMSQVLSDNFLYRSKEFSKRLYNLVVKLYTANKPRIDHVDKDTYLLYNYKNHVLISKEELLDKSSYIFSKSNGCYIVNRNESFFIEPSELGVICSSFYGEEIIDYVYTGYNEVVVRTDDEDYTINISDLFKGNINIESINEYLGYLKESIIYQNLMYPNRYIKLSDRVIKVNGNVICGTDYLDSYLGKLKNEEDIIKFEKMLESHKDLRLTRMVREEGKAKIVSSNYITDCTTGETFKVMEV